MNQAWRLISGTAEPSVVCTGSSEIQTTTPLACIALPSEMGRKNGARLHATADIARSYETPQCGLQATANARAKYSDWLVLSTYVIRALNTCRHFGYSVKRPQKPF